MTLHYGHMQLFFQIHKFDSSEETEYSRHKRFDKFSNEREKYDTLSSSRKRQYSSTSSDYSSSGEPMSKRTKTDQSSHNVNSTGVKLRLETDSPCEISLRVNSASSSQSDASKVLPKPDHKSKTQRRNRSKRQLRKKGEHYEVKYESRYSREFGRDNTTGHLPRNESNFSRQNSRDLYYNIPIHESSYDREYSRDQYDYLAKHKSGDNQEKTKGTKSEGIEFRSEEREYSRHKRFDKFSNEREKYDTFSSSRKRQYSSTSSDYSSSGEPVSKRTKTDQSPQSVNLSGVKLRLETDSPCQMSLKVNSASSSQSDASKVLPKPDHQSKTQRRNRRKRQLRKKGEHFEDRQDTLRHQYNTVYPRENERVNMCDDLSKYESRYSREFRRDNMSDHLVQHESRSSREFTRDWPHHLLILPKNDSKYSREYDRDNTTGHLPWNESSFSRQNSRELCDRIPKHESSYGREYSRDQYDYLPKHKSGYKQEKTEGKKSGNSREKRRDTKYEDDMYPRYDFSRDNNRVNVTAFRSSSESDQSEHDQCYRRKDYK
uniref:Uncharacterized protein n=1 Tax=Biomphalaria glabrata TaxID=6526 RepID=A0A2C9KQK0_BIOGL